MMKIAKHFAPNLGTILIVSLFLLVQSAAGSPPAPAALSQAPSATLISYQGRLADAGGNPLTGDYQMQFALYSVPTDGSACWSETQTVSVSNGLFNVLLGSATAIDPACLTGDVYLGITVGSDLEMTPRELLTSVPHAVQASTVPDGSITADKLDLVDGKVGIGLPNPSTKLEVAGQIRSVNADGHGLYSKSQATGNWGGVFVNNYGGTEREVDLAGSTYAAIFKNGNVGIGTASPADDLHVAGDVAIGTASEYCIKGWDGSSWANKICLQYNDGDLDLVRNGGNVGIGITSPGAKLDVSGGTKGIRVGGVSSSTDAFGLAIASNGVQETGAGIAYGVYIPSDFHGSSTRFYSIYDASGSYKYFNGNVGIGTMDPSEKLQVNGNLNMTNQQIKNVSRISSSGDLTIDAGDGPRRTLTLQDDVRLPDGNLTVEGDGTSKVEGNLQVGNNSASPSFAGMDGNDMYVDGQFEQAGSGGARLYTVGVGRDPESGAGTLAVANDIVTGGWIKSPGGADLWIDAGAGTHGTLSLHDDVRIASGTLNMGGNSILNCGALVEANLQTPEELAAEQVSRFEEGDVLCWGDGQLEKCSASGNPAVQAVANRNGKPIVIGAEIIKVLGPVEKNDFLVASSVPGYAVADGNPALGTVIAQALEDFSGEEGVIKAMIRKF